MDKIGGIDLVDFHCHLDLHKDMAAAYRRCEALRCATLSMTTTPKAFERNRQFAARTRFVKAALGLHPQLVADRAAELPLLESLLPSTRYVGEIGLDAGKAHYPSFDKQQQIFDRILRLCANQGGKIISVHSVRCPKKVLDSIEIAGVHRTCFVILHWFSAPRSEIQRAIDMGCYFSINERLLSNENGRALVELSPQDRVVTETDAPFLEHCSRPIEAGDVHRCLTLLAEFWSMQTDIVQSKIAKNASSLFRGL